VLFGGRPLKDHTIPDCFGAIEPTAVFVPLQEAIKPEHFSTVCKEVFGPFQVSRICSARRTLAPLARWPWGGQQPGRCQLPP
jgi:hypothetical protein